MQGALPPCNAFGADGVDVRGKIVVARYDDNGRVLNPKLAYQHGAAGCINYSNPSDGGLLQGRRLARGRMAAA